MTNTETTEPVRRLCQKILLAGDSNDSVAATTDELLSRVAKKALNAFETSNVIVVTLGDDLQDALDAAGAKATIDNPVIVIDYGGVYTGALDIPDNVVYKNEQALAQTSQRSIGELPSAVTLAPREPWVIPFPSLISLRLDDGSVLNGNAVGSHTSWWDTVDNTLDINGLKCTPSLYAALNGIPITASLVTDNIIQNGASDFFTADGLKQLVWGQGWELAAHCDSSANHANATLSTDEVIAIMEKTAAAIKNMVVTIAGQTSTTALLGSSNEIGAVLSGQWSAANNLSSTVRMSADDYSQGPSSAHSKLMAFYRSRFPWVEGYLRQGMISGGRLPYGSLSALQLYADTPVASIQAFIEAAATPGMRSEIMMHSNASGNTTTFTTAQFKAIIDAIVTYRAAGTLCAVTTTALYQAQTIYPTYDSAGNMMTVRWGGVPNGSFELVAGTLSTSDASLTGWRGYNANASIQTTGGVTAYGSGTKCLKLNATAGGLAGFYQTLIGGRTYLLRFKAKSTNGTEKIERKYYLDRNAALSTYGIAAASTPAIPNTWTTQHFVYRPPTWSDQQNIRLTSSGTGEVLIDDTEQIRIG